MVAFVPISPAAARHLLTGVSEADAGEFLSAFVEAGRIKAYADVIETLPADADPMLGGRISTALWRRIVAEGKLVQALTLASVRLDGDGLVGGRPAVMITGIRFNHDNVRKIAAEHGPTPPPAAVVVPTEPKAVGKAPRATPIAPEPDAPPLIEIVGDVPPSDPAPAHIPRKGLSEDTVMVSIADAKDILDLGNTTIHKLIGRGDLRVKKAGRRTLIFADSIREYLARP